MLFLDCRLTNWHQIKTDVKLNYLVSLKFQPENTIRWNSGFSKVDALRGHGFKSWQSGCGSEYCCVDVSIHF